MAVDLDVILGHDRFRGNIFQMGALVLDHAIAIARDSSNHVVVGQHTDDIVVRDPLRMGRLQHER